MIAGDTVVAGPLVVSPQEACAAWLAGEPLALTARQVRLLGLLARARGRLLSREELFLGATGRELPAGSRAVDMDLWRIRRALGDHARFLGSVRKVGYRLNVHGLQLLAPSETDS